MPERQVNFASSADVSVVSGHTLDVVLSLLMASDCLHGNEHDSNPGFASPGDGQLALCQSREVEGPRHRAVVNRRPRRVPRRDSGGEVSRGDFQILFSGASRPCVSHRGATTLTRVRTARLDRCPGAIRRSQPGG